MLQAHEAGLRIVSACRTHLQALARLYQRFMHNDERDCVLGFLTAAVLMDDSIVLRAQLCDDLTLLSNSGVAVKVVDGAGAATAAAPVPVAVPPPGPPSTQASTTSNGKLTCPSLPLSRH